MSSGRCTMTDMNNATPTLRQLETWIKAARREAQRAWERGDHNAVAHFEARITELNRMWK